MKISPLIFEMQAYFNRIDPLRIRDSELEYPISDIKRFMQQIQEIYIRSRDLLNQCNNCSVKKCCCLAIHRSNRSILSTFFYYTKTLFAAELGIEILCISAAVIGENIALYTFGFNLQGIIIGYGFGYAAAGFATFMTILGRYDIKNTRIDTCCSVLEQVSIKGFLPNIIWTFKNFGLGFSNMFHVHRQPQIENLEDKPCHFDYC